MQLSLDPNPAQYYITAYKTGEVSINHISYHHSLIVSENKLILDWQVSGIGELKLSDCKIISNLQPQIVLLGTGSRLELPNKDLIPWFHQQGIGIELMTNKAVSRTFNVLISEGRKTAAVFLI